MENKTFTRRGFVGSLAAAIGYLGIGPTRSLSAQTTRARRRDPSEAEYDAFAKLSSNENPYGPSDAVMEAMNHAFKYANRYGYPDGNILEAIAEHHGVQPENVLLGAGSGEILRIVGHTFLRIRKKVVGVEPTYGSVYSQASGIKADAIKLPLLSDYRQDMPAIIDATKKNYRDVGFVYICNPNNPTGIIVTKQENERLLDSIPEDVPVLMDEAYHHFVEDPDYATAIPYVLEGRQVIVARTFSKIAGMAAIRLGYAVAPKNLIDQMRPMGTGSISAIAKWGGATAIKDTDEQEQVRAITLELRKKTTAELGRLGFECIPSETNFFMVHLGRQVRPVIEEFRERGVLVGRPFPPMLEHLRVSIGTAEEMERFITAFKEIFPNGKPATTGG